MTFQILIAILMMAAIIILLFKEVSSPGVIFTAVPILAALLMGYSPREINGFIGDGLKSISGTLFLMVFAVLYFGILHEAGVFQALVRFVMHFLGNSVLGTLIVTCFVGMGTQLDGSGATTALCTIPAMKPIYDRQKIRPEALLLIESLASGVFCLLPWAPGIVEGSAYVGVDVFDVFTIILPVLIFSVILLLLFCLPVSIVEKRHGAGLSSDEFADLKKQISQPVSYPFGKKIATFDALLTLAVMILLLSGNVPSTFAFGLGFGVLLIVNYRTVQAQRDYIKRQAPTTLNMAFTLLGVAVLVGVNNGTGELKALAELIVAHVSPSVLSHLPFLLCVISLPLSITLGGSKNSIVLPAIIPMVTSLGFTPEQVFGTVFACGVISANLSLFNAAPYLALGLAEVEMKDHLRYSLLPVYAFSLLMLAFMVISGILPI